MNCLSFDVGGTTIKYGVINDSYEVILKDKIPTPKNEKMFINSLSEIIRKNIKNISKVSVAMPGYVNIAKNKYLYGAHLKYDIDFSKLSNFLEYEFYLDNDGNMIDKLENVGFKMKGNTSRQWPEYTYDSGDGLLSFKPRRFSFGLKFDEKFDLKLDSNLNLRKFQIQAKLI